MRLHNREDSHDIGLPRAGSGGQTRRLWSWAMPRAILDESVLPRFKAGERVADLARSFGVDCAVVSQHLRKRGVPPQKSRLSWPLIVKRYNSGASLKELTVEFSAAQSTIFTGLRRNGVEMRPRVIRSGPDHAQWRGGAYKGRDGYLSTSDGKKCHRVIAARLLGRDLQFWEDVHHVNEDRTDNSERNLVVMPHREHNRFHTFLRHRNIEADRSVLESLCRAAGPHEFRFTLDDLHAARARMPCVKDRPFKRCRIRGCDGKSYGRGLCGRHFQRRRAKQRGYWLAGAGRRAKYRGP